MSNPSHKEIKKQVAFWQKRLKKVELEVDKITGVINQLQDVCTHKYDNGTSAIQDDAFASQYAIPVCQICGKRFEKDNS